MKKKIMAICIVSMFVLMSIAILPAIGMETNILKESDAEKSTGGQIASATLYISRFEDQVLESDGDIVVSGLLSGSFFAHLTVIHNKVWTPYQIDGQWHCEIGANQIGTGKEYIFFDVTTPFDFGMSEDPPANINENSETKDLESGLYEVYWSIDIVIWVYENGERIDKIELHKYDSERQYISNKNTKCSLDNNIQIPNQKILSFNSLIQQFFDKQPRLFSIFKNLLKNLN